MSIARAVRARRDWIKRNPEEGAKYVRLTVAQRDKVDQLFIEGKTREVTATVNRLDEERLSKRRIVNRRNKALANIQRRLGDRIRYNARKVESRVDSMSPKQLDTAATATTDQLIDLARLEVSDDQVNPFWYH